MLTSIVQNSCLGLAHNQVTCSYGFLIVQGKDMSLSLSPIFSWGGSKFCHTKASFWD